MKNTKFYVCPDCGLVVETIHDSGIAPSCCSMKMDELLPNTVEASGEKHLPAVSVENGVVTVNVGSVNHPMQDVHYIEWVQPVTENGMSSSIWAMTSRSRFTPTAISTVCGKPN